MNHDEDAVHCDIHESCPDDFDTCAECKEHAKKQEEEDDENPNR